MIKAPTEFKGVIDALLIDPKVIGDIGVSIAEFALAQVQRDKIPEIKRFIDDLLSGAYSDETLKQWFDQLPIGFYFFDAEGIKALLRSLQSELTKPQYGLISS